jgi:hypothetical protein
LQKVGESPSTTGVFDTINGLIEELKGGEVIAQGRTKLEISME